MKARIGSRVQRDAGSKYDTVSEGMGYGMLLAVYFNDRATFDQLWTYVQVHLTARNRRGETVYLMHWKVDSSDNDVSEFYIPVPHPKVWLLKSTWNLPYDDDRTYIASETDPGPDYLKASIWDRKPGSATDADMDIAAALVMASKRWNDLGYGHAAANMIKAILNHDTIQPTESSIYNGFILNGSLWGNYTCWNPSYFTPAWLKLFYQFITNTAGDYAYHYVWYNDSDPNNPTYYANRCLKVIDIMYEHMAMIKNTVFTTPGGNPPVTYRMILPPDWVDTSSGSAYKPDKKRAGSQASDRYYYIDDNMDGKIDDTNGTMGMSFNHYYDAIRVAWTMAMD